MKTIHDYSDDEKKIIDRGIDAHAHQINPEPYYNEFRDINTNDLENLFGICYRCRYFNYCITEFARVYSRCGNFDISLRGGDRMLDCTDFDQKGIMTLNEMKEIAYYIDVDIKKIGLL